MLNIVGDRYGRLTVVEFAYAKNRVSFWHCKCDCGNDYIGNSNSMRQGATQSCGCKHRERTAKLKLSHGECGTRLYDIWRNMKKRCLDSKNQYYGNYGGRGITIQEEWLQYEPFAKWARSSGYSDDLTIERVNNDGPYSPDNCRWATMAEQNLNKRNSLPEITVRGVSLSAAEWAEKTGVNYYTIRTWIKRRGTGYAAERLALGGME